MKGEMTMKNKLLNRYYLFSCIGVLIVSFYPLAMGVRVIHDILGKSKLVSV